MRQVPVYVVLPPRVLLLDVAGPLEVLRRANQVQSDVRFEVRYVAPTAEVHSSIGISLAAVEVVLVGRNRTELTLISTAPNVAQKVVAQADAQLARAMVARAT